MKRIQTLAINKQLVAAGYWLLAISRNRS